MRTVQILSRFFINFVSVFCFNAIQLVMREMLREMRGALRPMYGNGETEAIIRILFHWLKGWDTTALIVHGDDKLSEFVRGEARAALARLLDHEPVQYITGEARFHGLTLHVEPGVLIPRPETEQLVDMVCDRWGREEDLNVLDICTGSGCIAVALASSLRFARVEALDISPVAVRVARGNAARLKVRVDVKEADIFKWEPEEGRYEVIVSNPPYIEPGEAAGMDANVLDYEPHGALFVDGADPLAFVRRLAEVAARGLRPGGMVYIEINPRHAVSVRSLLEGAGLADVAIVRDFYGRERFAVAVMPD